jgi:hypothetical protein
LPWLTKSGKKEKEKGAKERRIKKQVINHLGCDPVVRV